MAVELNIEGMDQFKRKIEQLSNPKKVKQIARKAGRQAMNLVRDAARNAAKALDDPQTPEKIYKEIVVQGGKPRNSNEVKFKVGVRGGARIPYTNNDANRRAGKIGQSYQMEGKVFYWRLIEFGTSKMQAQPFMRPALEKNIEPVSNKFAEVFNAEIDKALSGAT